MVWLIRTFFLQILRWQVCLSLNKCRANLTTQHHKREVFFRICVGGFRSVITTLGWHKVMAEKSKVAEKAELPNLSYTLKYMKFTLFLKEEIENMSISLPHRGLQHFLDCQASDPFSKMRIHYRSLRMFLQVLQGVARVVFNTKPNSSSTFSPLTALYFTHENSKERKCI